MNYLDEVEQELRVKRAYFKNDSQYESFEKDVLEFVRTKLLQSFKNGVQVERSRSQKANKNSQASKQHLAFQLKGQVV